MVSWWWGTWVVLGSGHEGEECKLNSLYWPTPNHLSSEQLRDSGMVSHNEGPKNRRPGHGTPIRELLERRPDKGPSPKVAPGGKPWLWPQCWPVMDRGQDCCLTIYSHKMVFIAEDYWAENVNGTVVENPCLRLSSNKPLKKWTQCGPNPDIQYTSSSWFSPQRRERSATF